MVSFRITPGEYAALRLQFATSNTSRGGRRSLQAAFNKNRATMTAMLLNSKQTVEMDVFVVHAFVRSRQMLAAVEFSPPE